jgi:hypothetical protein
MKLSTEGQMIAEQVILKLFNLKRNSRDCVDFCYDQILKSCHFEPPEGKDVIVTAVYNFLQTGGTDGE